MGLCLFLCWLSVLSAYLAKTTSFKRISAPVLTAFAFVFFVTAVCAWPSATWWENLIRTLVMCSALLIFLPFIARFHRMAMLGSTLALAVIAVFLEVGV